jgi:hypothetical protein
MADRSRRGDRTFAPLPPGVVRIRLEGESAAGLADRIAAMPGVQVVTGPDTYPGDRIYLTVQVAGAAGEQPEENCG